MTTPEGKIKRQIDLLLKKYAPLYVFKPVPYGYGASTVDYVLCCKGQFLAIEAKAPGKVPTDRQMMMLDRIRTAGGVTFIIDGPFGLSQLRDYLDRNCERVEKAQASGPS